MFFSLELHRLYLDKATHGVLRYEGAFVCYTLELPWVGNQKQLSCIPEGCYSIQRRYSERFKEHLEVLNVENRSLILFHPANNAQRELKGCIAPVSQFLAEGWGSRSREAFERMKKIVFPLLEKGEVKVIVKQAEGEDSLRLLNPNHYERNRAQGSSPNS